MLTRFEFAAVQGLYDTAGFVELDNYTPEQAATLILQRLALNEGKTKNHYLTPQSEPAKTTTPNNLPRLGPFFGRDDELKRIADALAPTSRGWGALIDGPGGIGKTPSPSARPSSSPPGASDASFSSPPKLANSPPTASVSAAISLSRATWKCSMPWPVNWASPN
jgi:hypothetical protein